MSRHGFSYRLRMGRQLVTGYPWGTIVRSPVPRLRQAASPDPTPLQAALEAALLHVASRAPWSKEHPLGYESTGSQRWYISRWLTPHADQLVMQASAPDNWIRSLAPSAMQATGILDAGPCRLAFGVDDTDGTGWVIGPEGTAIAFTITRWRGSRTVVEHRKLPLPSRLAKRAAQQAFVTPHPTDRLLSALVRRFLLTDGFLSTHKFFSQDGVLGLTFMGCPPEYEPLTISLDGTSSRDGLEVLGLETAAEIVEACFVNPFYGIADVRCEHSKRDELLIVDDERSGGQLLLNWDSSL